MTKAQLKTELNKCLDEIASLKQKQAILYEPEALNEEITELYVKRDNLNKRIKEAG